MMRAFKWLFMLWLLTGVSGCHSEKKAAPPLRTYTVMAKPLNKELHFSGTLAPIKEYSMVSSMEAVVERMHYHYGQKVKRGEVVFTLTSMELQKQYNDTLTDYLKAKDNYAIVQAKFNGTKELWDAGLIAKNNYVSEKSGVDTARITLMQATRKLTELLEKMDENPEHLDWAHLNLSDFEQIKQVLAAQHNVIQLKASGDGVLLYPPKSGEDKTSRIMVGASVKAGQVLALVGNLSGIALEIDVPEVDIGAIHPGMKALITGVAFGQEQLEGVLVAVNAQASNTSTGGLPSFTAVVEVPHLTKAQQQWVKVGMSAAIAIKIAGEKKYFVPVSAVRREQGNSVIRIKNKQGIIEKQVVITGLVQGDWVVIESGVKAGDVVIYD